MPLMFNDLLTNAGISPSEVRLLRHHTEKPGKLTPYQLWREQPRDFEQRYQRTQNSNSRTLFRSKYWASFVCPTREETLFVGLFRISNCRPVPEDWKDPISGTRPGTENNRTYDLYDCEPVDSFSHFRENLWVDWGKGPRAWVQRADNQNKIVVKFSERDHFLDRLSSHLDVQQVEIDQLRADPERKERLSIYIERGPVGRQVKALRQGRCQLCEHLGLSPIAFNKRDGTPYAEAHHVFPVSKRGSLGAGNIMVLCPNHHREVHHGDFEVLEYKSDSWKVRLGARKLTISRTFP